MTKQYIGQRYADVKPVGFYVYLHRRESDDLAFYVGKGSTDRAWESISHTTWWHNVVSKHGKKIEIYRDGMRESCAFTLEKILIYTLRSLGHPLVNLTNGGDGVSGMRYSYTQRVNNSRAQGGRAVCCSSGLVFQTLAFAVEWLRDGGRPAAEGNISNCLKGQKESAYGYSWWYDGDQPKEYRDPRKRRSEKVSTPVICSNGILFDNCCRASEWLILNGHERATPAGVRACASGKRKTAYGLEWNYG